MKFAQFIKDKKVLLIGPAPYLMDGSILKKIAQYDTIVRLNRSVEMLEQLGRYTGTKIDILYHNIHISPEQGSFDYSLESWKRNGVKHVRIPYPPLPSSPNYIKNINIFQSKNANNILDSSIVEINLFNKIRKGCNNTSPNTGTIAIIDILENKPEVLHISGITFQKGKKIYMDGYRDVVNSEELVRKQNAIYRNHSIDCQLQFLKKELKKYDNVIYDKEVKSVLV